MHTHHTPAHPHPLPSEDRLSAAVGASADSLLFSADSDPLRVGWWSEWGVGGMGGEITWPLCAAPMDKNSFLFTGKGVMGG